MAAPQAAEASVNSDDAADQEPLAAEEARQPAGHRQHDGVGHQVAGQHPGGLVGAGREVAGDVRQGHVGHRGVQHLQERRQHHRRGDQPGVALGRQASPVAATGFSGGLRTPWRQWAAGIRGCLDRRARTFTVGTTDMPGPNRYCRHLLGVVEDDLHRHPLHDLDVVAGGVFRRQEAEVGAAAALDAVDVGGELHAGVGVDLTVTGWPTPHVASVAFP